MRLPGNKWLEEKHKTKRKRRSWRKLHLGLDLVSGEIVCSDLTTDDIGDPTALTDMLDQIDGPVDLFLADGAYDGGPTRDVLAERFGSMIEVTIPPPRNAALSPNAAQHPTVRDRHISEIQAYGFLTASDISARIAPSIIRWAIGRHTAELLMVRTRAFASI